MAGVAFAVEGDGVGFATESYAASALCTTLASLSGTLWRIRRANYTTGNIFHVDMTATKTNGKWTIGPVAYYVAQVTDDTCPASCIATGESTLNHSSRFSFWAAGALVGYDFGPASLSVWATQEFNAKASNHFAAVG